MIQRMVASLDLASSAYAYNYPSTNWFVITSSPEAEHKKLELILKESMTDEYFQYLEKAYEVKGIDLVTVIPTVKDGRYVLAISGKNGEYAKNIPLNNVPPQNDGSVKSSGE